MEKNERKYLWPKPWLINVILDAAELQGAADIVGDVRNGRVRYTTEMYGCKTEYRFAVSDLPRNRSLVHIELNELNEGDPAKREEKILKQFALLESLMLIDTG
jgi:hypothetical protein